MAAASSPVAYVAGPYRAADFLGRSRNIRNARNVAIALWQQGYVALCPHLNTAHFDGIIPDQAYLAGALELMRRCDLVVLIENWALSEGAMAEAAEAFRIGIPVYEWPELGKALTGMP